MRKVLRSLFIKKKVNTTDSPSAPILAKDTPSSEWYRSINQLPLTKFIDVIVDKNYSALIISGFPSQIELQITWNDIESEYADAIGDRETKIFNNLFRELSVLTIELQQVEMLIEILREVYYPAFAEKLNKLLFTDFVFDPKDDVAYNKMLDNCRTRSRSIKINIDLKTLEFEAIKEKHTGENKPFTREYFHSMLITISDHAKYQIMDNITVFEFCERIKRYTEYCKMMEAKAHA